MPECRKHHCDRLSDDVTRGMSANVKLRLKPIDPAGRGEPLGNRIIELADDRQRADNNDSRN